MSNAPHDPAAQPDTESRDSQVASAPQAEVIPFAIVEEFYKRRGKTLTASVIGFDPLDFWIGRFYVGIFGALAVVSIMLGAFFYLYEVFFVEGTFNLLAARLDPPAISSGLNFVGPGEQGFFWQWIVVFATIAFVSWMLRQVDISRKLGMGYEVPIAFGAVVSSWITLQWLRPFAMGAWGYGFPLGITHHLDWLANVGYHFYNLFYNPYHAIGISLLFASTLFLHMHGSAILSAAKRPGVVEHNVDVFWRNIIGYSVGEIGIHRVAFWTAAASVLASNVCILLTGPVVKDWNAFWAFWNKLPIWKVDGTGSLVLIGLGSLGLVFARRVRRPPPIDLEDAEYGGNQVEGSLGKQVYVPIVDQVFGNGRIGPIYLGVWGIISIFSFAICCAIILIEYMYKVGNNPIAFVRDFWVLTVRPPVKEVGLSLAPWHEGGAWIAATFFLTISVLTWFARIWDRARKTGLGTHLAWGFMIGALPLYFAIYIFRPLLMGRWSEAPGHGFRDILDWTNYINLLYGNFYYNPFHMISIFFLLGSVVLLAMHGATIVAASRYGAEREIDEMWAEGPGTYRSQLLWRWVMGFNANSLTIHYWCWWFAALCGLTGAIGLLLTGTVVTDWYAWGEQVGIVAPWPAPDWTPYINP
jgi:photosynthetic reaction center M subunit